MNSRWWRLSRTLFAVLALQALLAGYAARGQTAAAAAGNTASVWAWGNNRSAQLGFERAGTVAQRPTPVQVLAAGANQATKLAAGRQHSVLVRPDGTVHTWGDNSRGQLGIGSSLGNYNFPREIPGFGQVTDIAAGAFHTIMIANGRVYGWGDNTRGQLGAGTFDSCGGTGCNRTPVEITFPAGKVPVKVGAGDFHSFVIMADGTVWALGYNHLGQLGSGEATQTSSIPVPVVGYTEGSFLTDVVAITGGEAHSVALHGDGTVSVWGWNFYCQLGMGICEQKSNIINFRPIKNPHLTGVVAIAAGQWHNLALHGDGTVSAWGFNADGELGDSTNSPRVFPPVPGNDNVNHPKPWNTHTPVKVTGLTDVAAIDAGDFHSMALKKDGTVWHWGRNEAYQLGNTSGGPRVEPVEVAGYAGATMIAAGGSHSLSLRTLTVPTFPDVAGNHPYNEAISQLAARNIIRGYQDGRFGPDDTTLRAQMAALICRATGWDVEDHNNIFPDQDGVDSELWRNVGTLAFYKVALGYQDKLYHPTDEVLHAQTISFITRAMIAKGVWVKQPDIAALYPNVPAKSGHREDIATYVFYVGPLPGTGSVTENWVNWSTPSNRGWFAQALWLVLSK